jgi:hypothetical protein
LGTVKSNAVGFPRRLLAMVNTKHVKYTKGDYTVARLRADTKTPRIYAYQVYDTSKFYMISVGITPSVSGNVVRRQPNGDFKTLPHPVILEFYNKYMGGVDTTGRLAHGRYSLADVHITGRWNLKLYLGLFDIVLVNSYLIYKHFHPDIEHFEFLHLLAVQLVNFTEVAWRQGERKFTKSPRSRTPGRPHRKHPHSQKSPVGHRHVLKELAMKKRGVCFRPGCVRKIHTYCPVCAQSFCPCCFFKVSVHGGDESLEAGRSMPDNDR